MNKRTSGDKRKVMGLVGVLAAIIPLLCVPSALPVNAAAEAKGPLSYERSVALLNLGNSTLKKLERSESKAFKEYSINLAGAKAIDPNGFTEKVDGINTYIRYDEETRLIMTKWKELVPKQMEYAWETAKSNHAIATNSLCTELRSTFFQAYSAQTNLKLKQSELSLAIAKNKQDRFKLESGIFTAVELKESDYNLLKAQKGLDAAIHTYDNAVRSFSQIVGLPPETQFSEILYEDVFSDPRLKTVDYYVNEAFANRFDVTSLSAQIALKEQEKRIIETFCLYKTSTTAQIEYETLSNEIEQLGLDLEGMKRSITNEIKNAYVDVINAGKTVDNAVNIRNLQRRSFSNTQVRYQEGTISHNDLAQAEITLQQAEDDYNTTLFDYNTKIMRFKNATGIGPGY